MTRRKCIACGKRRDLIDRLRLCLGCEKRLYAMRRRRYPNHIRFFLSASGLAGFRSGGRIQWYTITGNLNGYPQGYTPTGKGASYHYF